MSGAVVALLVLLALAALTGWTVGAAGALCAFAITSGVVAVLGVVFVFGWCERRQTLYRRRLAAHAMHAHDGVPCYGDCLVRRRDAA